MKRFKAIIFSICFLLTGCVGLPITGISPTDQSIPRSIGTAMELAGESSPKDSPLTNNSLTAIPMQVGYGVRGSWFDLYFTDPLNPAARQITGGVDRPLSTTTEVS